MPMGYGELREMVRERGFDEVHRFPLKESGHEMVLIARRETILIPFAFPSKAVYLDKGDDSEIEDEVINSVLRWIDNQSGKTPNH